MINCEFKFIQKIRTITALKMGKGRYVLYPTKKTTILREKDRKPPRDSCGYH